MTKSTWKEMDRKVEGIYFGHGRLGYYVHLVYRVWYVRNGARRTTDRKHELELGPTLHEGDLNSDPELRYLQLAMRTGHQMAAPLIEYLENEREKRKPSRKKR